MRAERFYTILGLFIITGLLMSFGLLYYFFIEAEAKKTQTYVMFFDGSLKGLEAGSPVTYRGVKIGHISLIELTENTRKNQVLIPVYVEFFVEKGARNKTSPLEKLISTGWSADISKPNLVTGIADIEIIQVPGSIKVKRKSYHGYKLFPTATDEHKEYSLERTLETAEALLNGLKGLIDSNEVKGTLGAIHKTAVSFDRLAQSVDKQLPTVTSYLNQALKEFGQAAYSTKNLTDYLGQYPESLLRGKRAP